MCPPDEGLPHVSDDLPPVFVDRTLALTRSATIKGRDYWKNLRGNRAMPTRGDIAPRDMREFLSHVGLVEVVTGANGTVDYTMRVAGGKIEEIFGPLSGQPISRSLPPETVSRWGLVFDEIRKVGVPLAVSGRVAYANLRHLKYELFAAPLGEEGKVGAILGVLDIWPVT
ncbi:MAG TPA: PAS domain-containing protein [Rhizomicrobium sp.]|nr:PAS domain-containing protein [Rhizomicrobium sp.]